MIIIDWNDADRLGGDLGKSYFTSMMWSEVSLFIEIPRRIAVFGTIRVMPWVGVGAITIDEDT